MFAAQLCCGLCWRRVDGAGDKYFSNSSYCIHLFSCCLLLVIIAFLSWICMSCTQINETQTSLANWHHLLLDWLHYPSCWKTSLHQTNGLFLVSVVQKMTMACHGNFRTSFCSGANISLSIIGVAFYAVLCFYSNSGHTEFPFGCIVINLSLLISCIPQAFQQGGGLKAESCIVDWMHCLSSDAITNQAP